MAMRREGIALRGLHFTWGWVRGAAPSSLPARGPSCGGPEDDALPSRLTVPPRFALAAVNAPAASSGDRALYAVHCHVPLDMLRNAFLPLGLHVTKFFSAGCRRAGKRAGLAPGCGQTVSSRSVSGPPIGRVASVTSLARTGSESWSLAWKKLRVLISSEVSGSPGLLAPHWIGSRVCFQVIPRDSLAVEMSYVN
ncbi:unnamed protein product [Caretta caretta]